MIAYGKWHYSAEESDESETKTGNNIHYVFLCLLKHTQHLCTKGNYQFILTDNSFTITIVPGNNKPNNQIVWVGKSIPPVVFTPWYKKYLPRFHLYFNTNDNHK